MHLRKLLVLEKKSLLEPRTVGVLTATRKISKDIKKRQQAAENIQEVPQETRECENFLKFYKEDGTSANFSDRYTPLVDEDYNRFLSETSLKRVPSITRLITSLAYKVGKNMVSLAEGMPNEEVFPFNQMYLKFKTGGEIYMKGDQLATALQYVPSQGLPSLITTIREFQTSVHRPPEVERDYMVVNGGQHGIYQCCELLLELGDPVLMAEYSYSGIHVALRPYNPEILSIPEDQDGIKTEVMESILSTRKAEGLKMPKMLYIVPIGNNPTGTLLSEQRKKEVYELACKYDFLIVEDDPYMFLNYTNKPVPSFLSMDSCGRVIRLDSLSKVVSAGLRAGWVTAPRTLARRLELHSQAELLHSCSLGQSIMDQVLSDRKALSVHLQSVRDFYKNRRDKLNAALCSAGIADLAEWNVPDAGLFLWMKVKGVEDVYNMVFKTAFERGLMLIPGHAFLYDSNTTSTYLRLTFSKVPIEQMHSAARTLADVIRSERSAPTHGTTTER